MGSPAGASRQVLSQADQLGVELAPDHVPLGLVVAEERSTADPDGGGDVVHRGLVVTRAARRGRGRPAIWARVVLGRRPLATSVPAASPDSP